MQDESLGNWTNLPDNGDNGSPPGQFTSFDNNDRDAILAALRRFCSQLDLRLEMFTDQDPTMLEIFDGSAQVNSDMIGQKVHTFLSRWLVEPIFSAVRYEFVAEPRGSKYEPEDRLGDVRPDFRIVPDRWTDSSLPLIIGEIKKPGGADQAVSEIKEYLSETSAPSYGIATDGLSVHIRIQNEQGDVEIPSGAANVSLRQLLHRIRRGVVHDRANVELSQFRNSTPMNMLINTLEQLPATAPDEM